MVSREQIELARTLRIPVAFENRFGMRFVLIPAATFTMGSPGEEANRKADELLHTVTLSRPFYISIHEVTNAQYRRMRPDHNYTDRWGADVAIDWGDVGAPSRPVVDIDRRTALMYAKWLSGMDAERIYSLPTEAQWEWAARSGSGGQYYWGESRQDLPRFVNFADRSSSFDCRIVDLDDGHPHASIVGSFEPNGFGLYDALGNAWEWCRDGYAPYREGHTVDAMGPAEAQYGILRGGSFMNGALNIRLATRSSVPPDFSNLGTGFRLVARVP